MKILKYVVTREIPSEIKYATAGSAGIDLYATDSITLLKQEIVKIPTGIKIEIPKNYEGTIRPRSSLNLCGVISLLGTIDSDYRGEIHCVFINLSKSIYEINYGERIAQLVISPYCKMKIKRVKNLSKTIRGNGGFGSTGK